ncbi:DUF2064 domain-containing protein [Algibacter miyuki]|uniref:DUF2064 domain-containing protein n=1 Tax=Algibacter miyuki TaxID=1306933 RepID=A0ABV5H1A3_9FLAO|nr:DUF2064 domain-containing protein [Algibacter miyuki]MDN3666287.1 DUF2064 domain-containing protein [Algibacter miyuki]
MIYNKIALLIFANSGQQEVLSKSFSSSNLFDALNERTLKIAKQTGLPYFHVSEKQQTGDSFGERFTNAIQIIYTKGFDTVITIGNDTPHLKSAHILKTVDKLKTCPLVLGPSRDGGFYLMGLKKSHFNKALFLSLPWQRANLNNCISKLIISNKTEVLYLEALTDIDNSSDIKHILDSFKSLSTSLKFILLQYLALVSKAIFHSAIIFRILYFQSPHNKGSPIPLHF